MLCKNLQTYLLSWKLLAHLLKHMVVYWSQASLHRCVLVVVQKRLGASLLKLSALWMPVGAVFSKARCYFDNAFSYGCHRPPTWLNVKANTWALTSPLPFLVETTTFFVCPTVLTKSTFLCCLPSLTLLIGTLTLYCIYAIVS